MSFKPYECTVLSFFWHVRTNKWFIFDGEALWEGPLVAAPAPAPLVLSLGTNVLDRQKWGA